ncbi:hypothetical protein P7D85_09330 [Enterococcus hulanensis]|uniref:Uncharacterized protein n=1 Tax=Enterococcus hulanensis TaxID=2559929 RepID=A0ABU3EYM3_9ENTE|nr:hypothetical protein [Enterococcus hulanensis]MDT2599977.1 hypothetical protein [Enterococcus hulanensis]MDT2610051.1 hypothetical protein [Enterococcus hulanensis]MDT2617859.1 hypothetical protein [Enterococcus hulanensis]MDT2629829.1 hypothetical protein [Enterococcus hulanensis]MDT2656424.1 hypothetical protein [Enterococcus hulanensis]
MKLIDVKRKYGLNQNTFYGWLRENQLIVKEITGYVVGPNALEGMETSTNKRVNEDGEVLIMTQVTIDNQKVPQLLERYESSGLSKLYSQQKQNDEQEKTSIIDVAKRLTILEKQVYILTEQLAITMKQNSREHE